MAAGSMSLFVPSLSVRERAVARRADTVSVCRRNCHGRASLSMRAAGNVHAAQTWLRTVKSPKTDFVLTVRAATQPSDLERAERIWSQTLPVESLRPTERFADSDSAASWETATVLVVECNGVLVGAARFLFERTNVCFDRVAVLQSHRGRGIGRKLLETMLLFASPACGAIFIEALPFQLGFFSILGFECQGKEKFDESRRAPVRTMVFRVPTSPVPPMEASSPGLHHVTVCVSDIERSLAFYGAIGFSLSEKFMSGERRACFLEGYATRVELVERPSDDLSDDLQGVRGVPRVGVDRLVFDVSRATPDLELFLEQLRKQNGGLMSVVARPSQHVYGRHVVSTAAIEDPDGFPLEFMRYEASLSAQLVADVDW
ncbi:hypothetical protein FVE85_2392 [Porphyridium purpureum]|uniref:N-acetyltransferase domain-containing protein n=1 Tax=Porphyridium purpureum TaxID=35688 RepID=A0A5J4Z0N4_PORPP|nr:hypothetical protein FVE85_2392 [Porphyridium purpureum]|eukprot:POR3150..scf209_3